MIIILSVVSFLGACHAMSKGAAVKSTFLIRQDNVIIQKVSSTCPFPYKKIEILVSLFFNLFEILVLINVFCLFINFILFFKFLGNSKIWFKAFGGEKGWKIIGFPRLGLVGFWYQNRGGSQRFG